MVKKLHAKGFDECMQLIASNENSRNPLFLLFSGSKDASSGNSWCPDCVEAQPIIEKALESAPEQSIFIYVEVGQRPYWKDPNNPFRTDSRLQLTSVPTLIKYGTPQRLEGEQCFNLDTVQMLFEDS